MVVGFATPLLSSPFARQTRDLPIGRCRADGEQLLQAEAAQSRPVLLARTHWRSGGLRMRRTYVGMNPVSSSASCNRPRA